MLMILLANMLILAHAVVPHHHHNKVFVAIVNVLDDDARDRRTGPQRRLRARRAQCRPAVRQEDIGYWATLSHSTHVVIAKGLCETGNGLAEVFHNPVSVFVRLLTVVSLPCTLRNLHVGENGCEG